MSAAGSIKKPMLRGSLAAKLKVNAGVAFAVAIAAGVMWKYGLMEPRKQKYLDFYKTYDPKYDFERMRKGGVFQSVNTDGSPGDL